jgi:hypothetical protein
MKKNILMAVFCLILSAMSFAQVPQMMSYQAVVRGSDNNLVVNQQISMRVSILQGSTDGVAIYTETHSATTNANGLASNLLAEDGSVGIRVTNEEFSKELCFRFQKPIVSTSANISGEPTPQTFQEISDEIKNAVDYVVKYNQKSKEKHQPSSIVKIKENGEFKIIRP